MMFSVKVSSEVRGDEVMGPFASRVEAERESERLKASGGFSKNEVVEDDGKVEEKVVEFPKADAPPVEPALRLTPSPPSEYPSTYEAPKEKDEVDEDAPTPVERGHSSKRHR